VSRLSSPGQWSRIFNVGLLVGGFGLGQGSIFVAQTWLVAQGELVLLAEFGTHFMVATLGTLFVDAGAITLLARHVAHLPGGQVSKADISRFFWETSLFRLILATFTILGGAAYALTSSDEFSRSYMLSAAPGFLLWAANGAGMLDGLKLSGVSGVTGSITYVASALALALAEHASPAAAGAILGGAFSAGNLATVAIQWAVLGRHGLRPQSPTLTRSGFARAAKDGFAMLGGMLPGQLYFRFQLLLSTTLLGAAPTALLLYARQIISGITQVIGFVLRVEFPGLVQVCARTDKLGFATIFGAQKTAAFLALGLTTAVLGAGFFMTFAQQENFSKVGLLMIAFSPTILTISTMWIVAQALAALSRYTALAVILTVFHVIGMVVSYLTVTRYGVYAFVIGDLAAHATGLLLLCLFLRDQAQRAGALLTAQGR
jgi:hypothetical protein